MPIPAFCWIFLHHLAIVYVLTGIFIFLTMMIRYPIVLGFFVLSV